MKKRSKFDIFVNIWISLVINIVLCIVLPMAAIGTLTTAIFLKGFAIAFPLSTVFVFLVPIVELGEKFASLFKVKPRSFPALLLSTAVVALFLGTFMSLLMTAVNAGLGPWFIAAWLSAYGWALLSVYVSAIAGTITAIPIAIKLFGAPGAPSSKSLDN